MGIQIIDRQMLSQRKLEGYLEWCRIIQYGRQNPLWFTENILGVEFMDYQKYIFMNTWVTPFVCLTMSRNAGKSFLSAPLLMSKAMLFGDWTAYIISSNGAQAQETFMKLEKMAKKQIASIPNLTDIFANELITSNANRSGFVHKPDDFNTSLYNGSSIHTLTSNYDGSRGKRSNCNVYDETGFMIENAFATTEPFTTQNSEFILGSGIDIELEPKNIPNQLIYMSSASSIDTYFWKKYKGFAQRMLIGDKNYFCADINCDIVLKPFFNGKPWAKPLLTQEKIDNAMREDKETALREYYNIFEKDGGNKQPFKRGRIITNSLPYVPEIRNTSVEERKIGLFYDPARSYDNSVVLIVEYYKENEEDGWRMKILNCISLVDIGTHKKIPMQTQDQLKYIRQMLLDYNNSNAGFLDYSNIEVFAIDAGAGGGGVNYADFFMEDWIDDKGRKHRGLIDKEYSAEYVRKFPNAIDTLKLINSKQCRTDMFDALQKMMDADLITFTNQYDGNDFIMIPIEKEIKYIEKDKKTKEDVEKSTMEIDYIRVDLDFEEKLGLKNIDLMKKEITHIYRFDNPEHTSHTYRLPKDLEAKEHDDRAFCLAMSGHYLAQLRRENIVNKKVNKSFDPKRGVKSRKPKVHA